MPFEEDEEDISAGPLYSTDDKRGGGGRSEFSASKGSRSRSGRRRYRSKSEDVHDKRKYDEITEELSRITRTVTQKSKKKKRVRMRMGSLTKIEGQKPPKEKTPNKPKL